MNYRREIDKECKCSAPLVIDLGPENTAMIPGNTYKKMNTHPL